MQGTTLPSAMSGSLVVMRQRCRVPVVCWRTCWLVGKMSLVFSKFLHFVNLRHTWSFCFEILGNISHPKNSDTVPLFWATPVCSVQDSFIWKSLHTLIHDAWSSYYYFKRFWEWWVLFSQKQYCIRCWCHYLRSSLNNWFYNKHKIFLDSAKHKTIYQQN